MLPIKAVLVQRGIKHRWFASQILVSESLLSRLLSGKRSWQPDQRTRAAAILGLPESVLFP